MPSIFNHESCSSAACRRWSHLRRRSSVDCRQRYRLFAGNRRTGHTFADVVLSLEHHFSCCTTRQPAQPLRLQGESSPLLLPACGRNHFQDRPRGQIRRINDCFGIGECLIASHGAGAITPSERERQPGARGRKRLEGGQGGRLVPLWMDGSTHSCRTARSSKSIDVGPFMVIRKVQDRQDGLAQNRRGNASSNASAS